MRIYCRMGPLTVGAQRPPKLAVNLSSAGKTYILPNHVSCQPGLILHQPRTPAWYATSYPTADETYSKYHQRVSHESLGDIGVRKLSKSGHAAFLCCNVETRWTRLRMILNVSLLRSGFATPVVTRQSLEQTSNFGRQELEVHKEACYI